MSLHGKLSRKKNNSNVYYSEENLLIGKYIEQRKELHGTSGQLNPRGSQTQFRKLISDCTSSINKLYGNFYLLETASKGTMTLITFSTRNQIKQKET